MSTTDSTSIDADGRQALLERLSELEEQVSNLRRLDEAVRRNAQMFESLLAGSRDGITLTTADGTLIRVVKSILGYPPLALAGTSFLGLTHPEDVPVMLASYHRLIAERAGQVAHEVRLRKPDGHYVWVEGTVTDMLDNPSVMAIVHNYRDATLRRNMETAVMERDFLAGHADFAFFSRSAEGVILSWSERAAELFGYEKGEILGQDVTALIAEESWVELESGCRIAVATGKPGPALTLTHRLKGGGILRRAVTLAPLLREGVVRAIAHLCDASRAAPG